MTSEKKTRSNVHTIVIFGLLASAAVIALTVRTFVHLFVPGGIAWKVPIIDTELTASGFVPSAEYRGSWEGEEVSGIATHVHTVVPDVNLVSQVCLVISVVAAALTVLTVIACTLKLSVNLLRDTLISHSSRRVSKVLWWSALIGAVVTLSAWHLGKNGVEAAVGVQADRDVGLGWWAGYVIVMFVIVSVAIVEAGFKRAMRLQEETEGLI